MLRRLHGSCRTRTWSTMGATWYRGEPSLRQSAQAASACGTSGAGPGMRRCTLSCLAVAGSCATAPVLELAIAR